MMAWSLILLSLAAFLLALSAASASFISDAVLQGHGSGGRSLLQAKTSCSVNFEFANYTIIISQCKGPRYPPQACCKAFKDFACPYAEQINDLTTDCATTMFSYINLYGRYPPGLFASECKEGKEGLQCPPLDSSLISSESLSRRISLTIFAAAVAVTSTLLFI